MFPFQDYLPFGFRRKWINAWIISSSYIYECMLLSNSNKSIKISFLIKRPIEEHINGKVDRFLLLACTHSPCTWCTFRYLFFFKKKKALQNGFKTNFKYTNENFHKMHHAWLIANIYVVFMKTDEIKRETCCRSKGYN